MSNDLANDLDRLLAMGSNEDNEEELSDSNDREIEYPKDCELDNDEFEYRTSVTDWPEIVVKGTSVNIVLALLDDSESIYGRHIISQVKNATEIMIEELRKIGQQKETFFVLQGFNRRYFIGNINKISESRVCKIVNSVDFSYCGTPLSSTGIWLAKRAKTVESKLNQAGISTSVNMILITDGEPFRDYSSLEDFYEEVVKRNKHWRITGVGIANSDSVEDINRFECTFKRMGIKKRAVSTVESLRSALYAFSKSVSKV